MKFAFIEASEVAFPVRTICRVLEVSSSGYYAWRRRPEPARVKQDAQLAVDTKSIRHIGIPDWIVDAARGDGRIWLLTRAVGAGNKPARVWSYSKRTLELVSELPIASCKSIVALGAAGDTLVVFSESWLASSRDVRSWKLTTFGKSVNPGFRSFACLDATHCLLGVAAPGLAVRFEAVGDIWASFAAPGLVVITTSAPNADDRYGSRKLVVGIDPN